MEDHRMTDLRTSGADPSVTATAPHRTVRWSAHAVEKTTLRWFTSTWTTTMTPVCLHILELVRN